MPAVRLAIAQTNPVVGDFEGNLTQIMSLAKEAADNGSHLLLLGEMALCGYPIEDLAARPSFLQASEAALTRLVKFSGEPGLRDLTIVVGHAAIADSSLQTLWARAQNRASVIRGGSLLGQYNKHHLPNYSVFDEYRNFVPGDTPLVFELRGLRFATLICEDIWQHGGPTSQLSEMNVDVTLVLNGSPFERGKDDQRLALASDLASRTSSAVVYANLVGGQDDLVFDGSSFVVSADGLEMARADSFVEDLLFVDIESKEKISVGRTTQQQAAPEWQVWNALVLGLGDYVNKNGFRGVVLGLSGGIDSSVCATLAVDALGPSRVLGISLPSRYSSEHSKSDAADLAKRLGIELRTEPIGEAFDVLEQQLALEHTAAENLQARIRGVILMGISNQEGYLTLTTGNKTELAVGYSTIYGDSVGGFAPIKDVEKTLVWQLANWRNEQTIGGIRNPIPQNSIIKPPSAELRPGQLDQDSLPPYDLLDDLLNRYIEQHCSREQLIALGFDEAIVDRVIALVDKAEWKRRQSAIGPKITGMAFGRDRRLPITNRYRQD